MHLCKRALVQAREWILAKRSLWYSRRLNNQLLIVHSARIAGSVFKFHKKDETHFACSSGKSLGKNRVITVANGRICDLLHQEISAITILHYVQ